MLNKVFIMGRLARDPELRRTQSGTAVASFTLAVDRDFKDKSTGERGVDWINCVAWRQSAEFVSRYFTKGRMAVVEGRLQVSEWTDKDGKTSYFNQVRLYKFEILTEQNVAVAQQPTQHQSPSFQPPYPQPAAQENDDLPF